MSGLSLGASARSFVEHLFINAGKADIRKQPEVYPLLNNTGLALPRGIVLKVDLTAAGLVNRLPTRAAFGAGAATGLWAVAQKALGIGERGDFMFQGETQCVGGDASIAGTFMMSNATGRLIIGAGVVKSIAIMRETNSAWAAAGDEKWAYFDTVSFLGFQ